MPSAQSWDSVVASFRAIAGAHAFYAPMSAAVEQLAASEQARELFPVKSAQSIRLFRHEQYEVTDEEVQLSWEGAEFVVRYWGGADRSRAWMKRGPDVQILLQTAFDQVRWFVGEQQS